MRIGQGEPFVGRRQEMARLRVALQSAAADGLQVVSIVGQPGIGKTRCAAELARQAADDGLVVTWGVSIEHAGAPPYAAWSQALADYVGTRTARQLATQLGPTAKVVAQLGDAVANRLGVEVPPVALDSAESARFRLHEAVAGWLERIARRRGLLLVLEDLHAADRATLTLLEHVALRGGRSRILIVCTSRDEIDHQHPLSATLGALTRERILQRITLGGLSVGEVGELVAGAGIAPPRADLVGQLHARSEGNPLFVQEMVRMLDEDPALLEPSPASGNDLPLPPSVSDAIGRRFAVLEPDHLLVLSQAATLGRELDGPLLAEVVGAAEAGEVLAALDAGCALGVLERLGGQRFRFRHGLIREVLLDAQTARDSARYHAAVADVLVRHIGESPEHAAEVAEHLWQARMTVPADQLARYSMLAGQHALELHSYYEAERHFERGTQALAGRPPDAKLGELVFGLARAQHYAAHDAPKVAQETLSRAFDLFIAAGDNARALAVAGYPLFTGGQTQPAELTARALELDAPETAALGRVLAQHGRSLYHATSDYPAAAAVLDRALAIAARENDRALRLRAVANLAEVEGYALHSAQCLRRSREALQLAGECGDRIAGIWPGIWTAYVSNACGDPAAALAATQAAGGAAEQVRDIRLASLVEALGNQLAHQLQGAWRRARHAGLRAARLYPAREMIQRGMYALLELETGNLALGEEQLQRGLGSEWFRTTPVAPNFAFASASLTLAVASRLVPGSNWATQAKGIAQRIMAAPSVNAIIGRLASLALAIVAVLEQDRPRIAQHYAELGQAAEPERFWWHAPSAAHALGLLAGGMDDLRGAGEHYELALSAARSAGYQACAAWVEFDYGALCVRLGDGAVRSRGQRLLRTALRTARALQMVVLQGLVERCIAEADRRRGSRSPDQLTRRELEVAALVAAGASNREIAQRLRITEKTVANHLTAVMAKADCRNRTEVAAYAFREGIAELPDRPVAPR